MPSSGPELEQVTNQVKDQLAVVWDSRPTRIIAVAIADDEQRNRYVNFSTRFGTPLTPALHNQVQDHYEFYCADYLDVGTVDFSIAVEMVHMADWQMHVPLPWPAIEGSLDKASMEGLNLWKKKFSEGYSIEFVQILSSY